MTHAGRAIAVAFDGTRVAAQPGDTVGSCLLRAGVFALRWSRSGQPRGLYCAIGVCNDCLVTIDGTPNIRACVTGVVDAMAVSSQVSPPNLGAKPTIDPAPTDGSAGGIASPEPVDHA